MGQPLSERYPVIFKGFDGIEYQATYRPQTSATLVSRVSVRRSDGKPIILQGKSYPDGYVAGHGDIFAENFLINLTATPE